MSPAFPQMRWAGSVWLAVWAPAYLSVWGWTSFVHLCDITVILTCVGLWSGSALLLSSQAVASVVIDLCWDLDVAWRLLFGRHLIGGTEYMFVSRYPLWIRLFSLFHVVWPVFLIWSLRRVGYDRRGWRLQSAIAGAALVISRLLGPEANINFAFRDPLFDRAWGPAPIHLAVIFFGLIGLIYWPTHQTLAVIFPQPAQRMPKDSGSPASAS